MRESQKPKGSGETDWGPHIHTLAQVPDQAWCRPMALGMVVAASLIYDHNMIGEFRVPALGVQRRVSDAAPAMPDPGPYSCFSTVQTGGRGKTNHSFQTH